MTKPGLIFHFSFSFFFSIQTNDVKRFMEPTIVTGVTWEDPLMQVTIVD